MPLYTVAYCGINSASFLGDGEGLTSSFMSHFDPEWQARSVKMSRSAEGRDRSAHDKSGDTLYVERADIFEILIKSPDMVVMIYCLVATRICSEGL